MQDALRELAERCVSAQSAHIIDFIVRGDRDRRVLELFVDAEGPITTELCSEISRQMTAEIEARGLLPGRYRLDVSSPGIERPLRFPWQYKKHVGRMLRVVVKGAAPREWQTGTLSSVDEDGIALLLPGATNAICVTWSEIADATVAPPW